MELQPTRREKTAGASKGAGLESRVLPPVRRKKTADPARIAALKQKINNEAYLHDAITRLALVVSNEYVGRGQRGMYDERKWEGGR